MAQVITKLNVDFARRTNDMLTAVQHDTNSRVLDCVLLNRGSEVDLTGHTVNLNVQDQDQKTVFVLGKVTDARRGRVQFTMPTEVLKTIGYYQVQIAVFKGKSEVLQCEAFKLFVGLSLLDQDANAIEATNEYGAMVVMMQSIFEGLKLINDMPALFGEPQTNAKRLDLDNVFKILDYLLADAQRTPAMESKLSYIYSYTSGLNSSTYGLNALRNLINRGMVKRVQRGRYGGKLDQTSSFTDTISISYVSTSKAILLIEPVGRSLEIKNAGSYTKQHVMGTMIDATLESSKITVRSVVAEFYDSSAQRIGYYADAFDWQVIEFY